MKRLKQWVIDQFLPAWAKEQVYQENEALKAEISRLKSTIREQNAYIDGLERGIRAQRRIIINTGARS